MTANAAPTPDTLAVIRAEGTKKRPFWVIELDNGVPINLVAYASHQNAVAGATTLGYTIKEKQA